MKYLAVLGRQPEISLAELTALFKDVKQISYDLAFFSCDEIPNVTRLGGSLKLAAKLESMPIEYLKELPDGKITIGVSDYSKRRLEKTARSEALKLKQILVRHGRSARVVENKGPVLSSATSLHNGLSGHNPKKVELIKVDNNWWRVIGVQDIEAYARRDQARPARDAKVGMLPPKLAQILINLCGELPKGSRILDPFCGTGVVLQETLLMGYRAYGTDISEKMVEYSKKNLEWLTANAAEKSFSGRSRPLGQVLCLLKDFSVAIGDATSFQWEQPIDAVACEGYLGRPMSLPPAEIKLKEEKQTCKTIILGFLKNLSSQIKPGTPVTMAIPAWLRPEGNYSKLGIVDEIDKLGYNVINKSGDGLLYARAGQVVAREIIILRKK